MHPILFRIGSFEIGSYGLLMALSFFAAVGLSKRLAKRDGVDPEHISDLAIIALLAGIIGSKLLMIIVDLLQGASLAQVFDPAVLRAGGAVHGGIILGVIGLIWRARKLGLQGWQILDILTPGIALAQAIGRVGCLAAGCCYGIECHLPWAITFHNPEAHRFSGTLLGVPLHPVQVYILCANLAVMGALLWMRPRRKFMGQLSALFFILEGTQRFLLEAFRGDLDRGTGWLGMGWLSTGRLTALSFVIFGIAFWVWMSRRARRTVAAA